MTEQELEYDLSQMEIMEGETPPIPGDTEIIEKAISIVQAAMKDVRQEMLLIDRDGTPHVAYIMNLDYDNGIVYTFNTPSEDKERVAQLVEECLNAQIQEAMAPKRRGFLSLFR